MTTPAAGSAAESRYLVRSEERLDVHTIQVPVGRARLEKFLVSETRTVTVEVTHEEVRLVRYDADGAATDAGGRPLNPVHPAVAPGADTNEFGNGRNHGNPGRWLTLSEERVIITREVVAVERVRLQVDTITEQQDVTERGPR